MSHLYMAMEALTPAAREQVLVETGLDRVELRHSWSIPQKSCPGCGLEYGRGDLDAEVRRRILFRDELALYKAAKEASDGLEHGYKDYEVIRASAFQHRDRLASLVRAAIFDLASVDADTRSALLRPSCDTPIAASRFAKYIRCRLRGDVQALAPSTESYPRFQLASTIESVAVSNEGDVTVKPHELVTARLGEGVEALGLNLEVWGPGGVVIRPEPV